MDAATTCSRREWTVNTRHRALILAGEGYGNVIMATPVMRAVQALGYETHVLVEDNWGDAGTLLQGCGLAGLYGNRAEIGETHFGVVVGTVWRQNIRGIPADRYVLPDRCDMRVTHEVEANMTAVRELGYAGATPAAFCSCTDARVDWDYIALCPGYGGHNRQEWGRKQWPHWEQLVAEHPDTQWVMVGTARDVEPWMRDRVCMTTDRPIREAASLLQSARAVVSVDNGLAHIAGALGCRTIVLFGATSEVKNAPRGPGVEIVAADMDCRPCQMTAAWNQCRDWRCMSDISVDMVADALGLGQAVESCA